VVSTAIATRIDAAWAVLHTVLDPEVPAVSVCDLGIVREVIEHEDGLEIVLTPTYSGCPATEAIEHDVLAAIEKAGLGRARATLRRAPAWSSDWISEEGRARLKAYGIAPPAHLTPEAAASTAMPIRLFGRIAGGERIACPRCASEHTERLSAFGSTACKALYRCMTCREPFEHFKPI
jgi:ring-1,2-phenylacetyl-CoA epoxidase subunit PaaD